MRLNTKETKAVCDKLFGKTQEEVRNQFAGLLRSCSHLDLSQYPFGVHVFPSPDGESCKVSVGFKGLYYVLNFTLQYYPACCGIRMFHHFHVSEDYITEDQLAELLNAFFKENRYDQASSPGGALGLNNRIEVIMVESRNGLQQRAGLLVAEQDIEPIDDPAVTYKSLWKYFHKYGKKVVTRLEANSNSGNVLHNMSVIL